MKEYETEVNGMPTTLLLSDEDAEAQGLSGGKEVEELQAASEVGPTSWSLEEETKQLDEQAKQAAEPETKKRTASNK